MRTVHSGGNLGGNCRLPFCRDIKTETEAKIAGLKKEIEDLKKVRLVLDAS